MKKLIFAAICLVSLGAGCTSSTPSPNSSNESASVSLNEDEQRLFRPITKYEHPVLGYSFMVPEGSVLEQDSLNSRHGRIQNYLSVDDRGGLGAGEYYLEFNTATGTKRQITSAESCSLGQQGNTFSYGNGFNAWVGLGQEGGDAGGQRYLLCVVSNEATIEIMVTSAFSDGPIIANTIFQSFSPAKGMAPSMMASVKP